MLSDVFAIFRLVVAGVVPFGGSACFRIDHEGTHVLLVLVYETTVDRMGQK
jgi:hypothetical protein